MIKTDTIGKGRYQSLVISIGVLLSLIIALLVFTFYTSRLLERNTVLINEANRVANSAQAVIKDLFDAQNSYGEDISSPHMQTLFNRLEENTKIINETLPILQEGGVVTLSNGSNVLLTSLQTNVAQDSLAISSKQWRLLEPRIKNYLSQARDISVDSSNALVRASTQAKTSSLFMNDALEALTQEIANNATSQASTIRLIQIIGVAIIFAYFLGFVFFFVGRLRKSDTQIEIARRETENIMKTVSTGLFLLDKDLVIGNQYSGALANIVGTNHLAGESLDSVLRNRISDKDLKTAQEFIKQLYNPRVKENLVHSLNPLNKIMIHSDTDSGAKSRYLDFKFSRVYEGKEISQILVNVEDVSEQVRLEQRLEKERSQNDRQVEMLTTILNVSPKMINEFIANVHMRIEKMNNVLKSPGGSQFELENKLRAIYREMHSLKGEASALKLHSFTVIASQAEDKLYALQNQGKLSGDDFLSLTVQLDELLNLSNTIRGLGERINSVAKAVSPQEISQHREALLFEDNETDEFAQYLVTFGQDIAKRQGKQIEVDVSRTKGVVVPEHLMPIVKEVSIQLLRNAIVHGIADGETRLKNGKSPNGKVTISFGDLAENKDCFVFVIEDDGFGIDYDDVRQKLVDSKAYTKEQANELTETQLLGILFSSGFSTKTVADEDGGRGVGLDIVKERIRQYQGKINVQSKKGKYARFIVKLPMKGGVVCTN